MVSNAPSNLAGSQRCHSLHGHRAPACLGYGIRAGHALGVLQRQGLWAGVWSSLEAQANAASCHLRPLLLPPQGRDRGGVGKTVTSQSSVLASKTWTCNVPLSIFRQRDCRLPGGTWQCALHLVTAGKAFAEEQGALSLRPACLPTSLEFRTDLFSWKMKSPSS